MTACAFHEASPGVWTADAEQDCGFGGSFSASFSEAPNGQSCGVFPDRVFSPGRYDGECFANEPRADADCVVHVYLGCDSATGTMLGEATLARVGNQWQGGALVSWHDLGASADKLGALVCADVYDLKLTAR